MIELLVVRDEDTRRDLRARTRQLVVDAFAGRFDDDDWEHGCGGWRVIAVDGDVPVAHAAVVDRELFVDDQPFATGYVEAVGAARARWNEGLGSLVMNAADTLIREHFALGGLSTGRQSFYRRLGWESWQGPSYVLSAGRPVRTAEEDAGLMVLRFGASADVALTAALTCHERAGDDW